MQKSKKEEKEVIYDSPDILFELARLGWILVLGVTKVSNWCHRHIVLLKLSG
jgi:hypothetical protein